MQARFSGGELNFVYKSKADSMSAGAGGVNGGGGEVGSWDAVLLEDLTEDNLLSNLNQRYKWDQVYVSERVEFPSQQSQLIHIVSRPLSRPTSAPISSS